MILPVADFSPTISQTLGTYKTLKPRSVNYSIKLALTVGKSVWFPPVIQILKCYSLSILFKDLFLIKGDN